MLNANSRQVRRGLRVGTCAPSPAELHGVRCHLLDLCDPGETFTVADWLTAARRASSGSIAPEPGPSWPEAPASTSPRSSTASIWPRCRRIRLRGRTVPSRRRHPEGLARSPPSCGERDPAGATEIDQRNPRRVIRALEILDAKGGSVLTARRRRTPRPAVMVALDVARPVHARWIEHRIAGMFDSGGIQDEVRWLLGRGLDRTAIGSCGIGYSEALDLIEGHIDLEAAMQATMRRTLRYARAQRTWFRRDTRLTWFRPDLVGFDEMVSDVLDLVAAAGNGQQRIDAGL